MPTTTGSLQFVNTQIVYFGAQSVPANQNHVYRLILSHNELPFSQVVLRGYFGLISAFNVASIQLDPQVIETRTYWTGRVNLQGREYVSRGRGALCAWIKPTDFMVGQAISFELYTEPA